MPINDAWSLPLGLITALFFALGTECLYRSVLQPKLGLFLTSTLLACSGYNFFGVYWQKIPLLWVLSLAIGWCARHYGIWTAVATHVGALWTIYTWTYLFG